MSRRHDGERFDKSQSPDPRHTDPRPADCVPTDRGPTDRGPTDRGPTGRTGAEAARPDYGPGREADEQTSSRGLDELVDLYLTEDLAVRRRSSVRDMILNDRDAYEQFRRARECHGILDDYCEYLRSGSADGRSRSERVLDDICDIGPSAGGDPIASRRHDEGTVGRRSGRRTEVWLGAAIVLIAASCAVTAFLIRAQRFEDRILARVSDVEGRVRVFGSDGSSSRVPDGYGVRSGDVLESGPDGSLVLELSTGGSARMDGDGRYALRSGGDARELRIDYGKVFVRGVTRGNDFRVSTDAGEIEPSSGTRGGTSERGSVRSRGVPSQDGGGGVGEESVPSEFEVDIEAPPELGGETGRSEIRLVVTSGGVIVRPVHGRRERIGPGSFDFGASGVTRVDRTRAIDSATAGTSGSREDIEPRGARSVDAAADEGVVPEHERESYEVAGNPEAISEAIDGWVDEAVALSALEGEELSLGSVLYRARVLTLRREGIVAAVRDLSSRDVRATFLNARREELRSSRRAKDDDERGRSALASALRHGVLVDLLALDPGNAAWGDTLIDLLETYDEPYEEAPILGSGLALVADRAALAHLEAASRARDQALNVRGLVAWAVLRGEGRRDWYPAAASSLVERLHELDPERFSARWIVPLLPFLDESVAQRLIAANVESGRLGRGSAVTELAVLLSADRDRQSRMRWDDLEPFYDDETTRDLVQAYLAARFVRGVGSVWGMRVGAGGASSGSSFGTCVTSSIGAGSLADIRRARREAWLIGKMAPASPLPRQWSRYRELMRRSPSQEAVWDDIVQASLSGNVEAPTRMDVAGRSKSRESAADYESRIEREVRGFCKDYLTTDSVAAAETMIEYVLFGVRERQSRPCNYPYSWFQSVVETVVSATEVSAEQARKAFLEWALCPPDGFEFRGWWEFFAE